MSRNAEVSIVIRARDLAARTIGRVKGELAGLRGSFMSLKAAAAAFGVAIAVHVGKKLFELGADVEETRNKFVTVFGDMTDQMDKFVKDFGTMSGIAKVQMEDMVARLGAIAQGMGFTRKASADFAQQIFKTAADLASFNNVSTADALADVQSGLAKMPRPLRKYGIMLSQAKIQQEALSESGKASADALTDQETALATLNIIRRQAGVQLGDNVRTQDSAQRSYRSLGAAITNIHQSLGVMVKTLVAANDKLLTARDSAESLDEKIQKNISSITAWANVIVQFVKFVALTLAEVFRMAFNLGQAIGDAIRAVFDGVVAAVAEFVVNPIVSMVNSAIDGLNHLPGVHIDFKFAGIDATKFLDDAQGSVERLGGDVSDLAKGFKRTVDRAGELGDAVAKARFAPQLFKPGTTAQLPGNIQTPGQGPGGEHDQVVQASKKMTKALDALKRKADLLGPSFDKNAAEAQVLKKALDAFTEHGADANTVIDAMGTTVGDVAERYKVLEEQLRATDVQQQAISKMVQESDQIMARHPGVAGYTGAVMKLNELLQRGLISQQAYQLELKNLRTQFAASSENATTFGQKIGAALVSATASARTMEQVMADMITGTIKDFADAISGAFQAFVTGAKSAGQAFIGAMVGAVATVARKMGEYFIAQGLAALGLALVPPPLGTPTGFAAAAKLFAAGAAMFAISGALGGVAAGGGGGGGGNSSATATTSQQEQLSKAKESTIVIEGGLLDMSDPRQADALAQAIGDLSDRRVIVEGG